MSTKPSAHPELQNAAQLHTDGVIAAAERAAPMLLQAAHQGKKPRAVFKRMLRVRQNRLSLGDWTVLAITLESLAPTPACEPRIQTARAQSPTSLPELS